MSKVEKPKQDNPEQSRRFEEDAKRLGVDETGKTFERAFKSVAQKNAKQAGQKKP